MVKWVDKGEDKKACEKENIREKEEKLNACERERERPKEVPNADL